MGIFCILCRVAQDVFVLVVVDGALLPCKDCPFVDFCFEADGFVIRFVLGKRLIEERIVQMWQSVLNVPRQFNETRTRILARVSSNYLGTFRTLCHIWTIRSSMSLSSRTKQMTKPSASKKKLINGQSLWGRRAPSTTTSTNTFWATRQRTQKITMGTFISCTKLTKK